MKTNTATTAIVEADPDGLFEVLTDVDHLAEWNHIISRVLRRPNEMTSGAEWVVEMHAMGQTWPSRSRVEAFDRAARRFSYRSGTDDANPSYTVWHWQIAPHPMGARVAVSWELNPKTFWRRHLIVHLRRRALAREVPSSIQALGHVARQTTTRPLH